MAWWLESFAQQHRSVSWLFLAAYLLQFFHLPYDFADRPPGEVEWVIAPRFERLP